MKQSISLSIEILFLIIVFQDILLNVTYTKEIWNTH